ncbi:reverse transcriptase domain-containing protein [Tanacetum coccineum]
MLERLSGNEYYCFLDGFSGFFQIPIAPEDQEKTTFTCPYGTFAQENDCRRIYWSMPFESMYDASDFAVGAVLGQRIDGKFKPIYYARKTLNDAHAHYTTTEKELLAVSLFRKQDAPNKAYQMGCCFFKIQYRDKDKKGAEKLGCRSPIKDSRESDISGISEMKSEDKFPLVPLEWTPEKKKRCDQMSGNLAILDNCHSGPTGGHHSALVTRRKVYEAGFYWPSIFKDAKDYVMKCDTCQKSGNISSRNEMPQNNIQVFAVDYLSKWVEAQALPTNDDRVVVKFLKGLFARFRVPKALISDRGTHFCNSQLEKALLRYG